MRHLKRFLATGLAATALASCGGGDLVLPSEGEPAVLLILRGNGQSGRVGEALAQPLVVKVLDGADRPVPSATVVVELAGASVNPDTLSTDGDGQASAAITLGSEVGETSGLLKVIAPESPVAVEASFTVIALAADANGIVAISGDDQTGTAGTTLPERLVVQVTDAFGNPIEGVPISWTADAGGTVSDATTTTDADGFSSVSRTLGPTSGAQTTLATSTGLAGSPVVFNHTVTAGSASGVTAVSGNGQSAPVGTALPQALVVSVVDEDANPVVDAAVTWVVTGGGGSLAPTTSRTDANGRASTTWTLGPSPGANTALAVVSGVGQAEFTATATAGPPSAISKVSGDGQTGLAGSQLPASLVVQVVDGASNPVSGVTVSWAVETGGGSVSPAQSTTGTDGRASSAWTLGPSAGGQAVRASVSGAGSVQFSATATAGAPSSIRIVAGDGQTGQVGSQLPASLVVEVVDASGNPVSGVSVSWAASGGGGSVSPTESTTGSNGQTSTVWTLGGSVGPQTVQASAAGLSPVQFTATGVAGPPSAISVVSGDDQIGQEGTTLPNSLVVEVVDASGNPLSGVPVTWEASSGGGSVSPTQSTTGADGQTSTAWTLGPALPDPQAVQASTAGVVPNAEFSATAVPAPPGAQSSAGKATP